MLRLRDVSEDTVLFPWNKSAPYPAVPSTIAVMVALLLGEATGHRAAASIAAGAAFTVGFAVFHEALASVVLSMGLASGGIALATLAGSLAGRWAATTGLLCFVVAVVYGVLAEVDNTVGWIGQQCGVFAIISCYFASDANYAFGRAGMVLAGGLLQAAVYVTFRLLRRQSAEAPPTLPLARQIHTRSGQVWRTVLERASFGNATFAYIARLAATVSVSTAIYRGWHLGNGYWAPMTGLLVLKPAWANTLSRGVARLSGTLAATVICLLLARLPMFHHSTYFVLITITAWACFTLQGVNYALFCMMLTMYTVFLFGFGQFSERAAADLRLLNTAVGGVVALLVDGISQWLRSRTATTTPPTKLV